MHLVNNFKIVNLQNQKVCYITNFSEQGPGLQKNHLSVRTVSTIFLVKQYINVQHQ